MNTEKVIKDFCPVKNVDVEITDNSPYASSVKLVGEKPHDNYPTLLCNKHCYKHDNTPSGCLYESITKEQPPTDARTCD